MRSETAMLDQILAFGREDDNIRAITLNGSRVNPGAEKDPYRDYDLVFHVKDLTPFLNDPGWCRIFGEIVIAQTPYFMEDSKDEFPNFMSWYKDGSRTDIRVQTLAGLRTYLAEDSLTSVLLDKDQCIPCMPEASDWMHHLKQPSRAKLADTVNEFYWVSLYVSKALARCQYIAAAKFLEIVREQLFCLLAWNCAHEEEYTINFGSHWKFLEAHLTEEERSAVWASYALSDPQGIYDSLAQCRDLFAKTLSAYSKKTGYQVSENVDAIQTLERTWLVPTK